MRHFLISALLLSLVTGCSSFNIGPHRIDVQQGNALDQENVARLKPGLNRSQVRFLLGTPLVVDPFRTDRWDYVYVFYKGGKLAEQKHITLFFEGDTLARIEGDLPPAMPAVEPESKAETPALPANTETNPVPATKSEAQISVAAPQTEHAAVTAAPVTETTPAPVPVPAAASAVAAPTAKPVSKTPQPPVLAAQRTNAPETSVVPPLPSPQDAAPYIDPHPPAELSLQPDTDVAKIQPVVIPSFSGPAPIAASDDPVMKSVQAWIAAWARRDKGAYFAAYDAHFVPADGGSRADWEKRKRQALNAGKSIEIKIDSPSVEREEEGTAKVTFKQFFRSGTYQDSVVKQLLMVEHEGRWLIAEEKILSTLPAARP
jgi:outer membrane protein assembly factor BamE